VKLCNFYDPDGPFKMMKGVRDAPQHMKACSTQAEAILHRHPSWTPLCTALSCSRGRNGSVMCSEVLLPTAELAVALVGWRLQDGR